MMIWNCHYYYLKYQINKQYIIARWLMNFYLRIQSVEKLYCLLKQEKWEKLNLYQKEVIFNNIEIKEAKIQSRKPAKIKLSFSRIDELEKLRLGKYDYKLNIIKLVITSNPLMMLKSYFYHQKKALQYQQVNDKNRKINLGIALSKIEYLNEPLLVNNRRLALQKLELDANFYAIKRIHQLNYLYQDDYNWLEIIKNNEMYISDICSLEKCNYQTIGELVNNNVVLAYEIGLISYKEYRKLIKQIKYCEFNIRRLYFHVINQNNKLKSDYEKRNLFLNNINNY